MSVSPFSASGTLPDPTHTTLLRAALGDASALDEFRREGGDGTWQRLSPGWQRLLPLLLLHHPPERFTPRELALLNAKLGDAQSENARLIQHARDLLAALQQEGIHTIVLKGLAVASLGYRGAEYRSMSEVDVLVPLADLSKAWKLLLRLDWWPQLPFPRSLQSNHACNFGRPVAPNLNLHWFSLPASRWANADQAFWNSSRVLQQDGLCTRVLCPAHNLVHLCIHGSGSFGGGLWAVDSLLVLRGDDVDWAEVERESQRRGAGPLMASMLAYLRDELGAAIPAACIQRLRSQPQPLVARLFNAINLRRRSRVGRLLLPLVQYAGICRPRGLLSGIQGFARHLADRWGLGSLRQLPRELLMRLSKTATTNFAHNFTPADEDEYRRRLLSWSQRERPAEPLVPAGEPDVLVQGLLPVRDYWNPVNLAHAELLIHPEHNQQSWALDALRQILTPAVRYQLAPLHTAAALEIGCGLGRMLRVMSAHVKQLYGVDISPRMVELSRGYLGPTDAIQTLVGDGATLPVPDRCVDLVSSVICFQHIPLREVIQQYLVEAYRVLRPGGVVRAQSVVDVGRRPPAEGSDPYNGDGYAYPNLQSYVDDYHSAGFRVLEAGQAGELYIWVTGVKIGGQGP